MPRPLVPLALITAALTAATLSGCVRNEPAAGGAGAITVEATDDSCAVSAATGASGTRTFQVTNSGTRPTEFELLGDDGLTIVGEVENIAPGLTRSLSVQAQPGTYTTLCKPGMVGKGVGRASFTVTGDRVELRGDVAELAATAATNYRAYVRDQASLLLEKTEDFAAAYTTDDDEAARSQYPGARAHWERIETVAEKFGDLDPELDARQADVAEGDTWTGWHLIEKDLWQPDADANGGQAYTPLTDAQRTEAADFLVSKTKELVALLEDPDFEVTADAISNGAIGLLDEVATSKVTGEEEIWSHTDLTDFKANVEGAEVAYRGVRDIVLERDESLAQTLDTRFATLNDLLAQYGSIDDGFIPYTDLTDAQVKELSDAVNALSEPLSMLTTTLLA